MASTLKLQDVLSRFGVAGLTGLIGPALEMSDASHQSLTPSKAAKMLVEIGGISILSNKKIRSSLISVLNDDECLEILPVGTAEGRNTHRGDEARAKLESLQWKFESDICQSLITFLELGEEFLPSAPFASAATIDSVKPQQPLHDYQKPLKDAIVSALRAHKNRLLVHMPTGAGKTRTTIEAVAEYWRHLRKGDSTVVWLADSQELCEQAVETFMHVWERLGDRELNVLRLWGSHKLVEGDLSGKEWFVVMGIQKAYSLRTSRRNDQQLLFNEISRRCKVVIMDEAHKSVAPTYEQVINSLTLGQESRLIGLTATPGRSDEEQTIKLREFYGSQKAGLMDIDGAPVEDPLKFLQEKRVLSLVNRGYIPSPSSALSEAEEKLLNKALERDQDIPNEILGVLSRNEARNLALVGKITECARTRKAVLVFACSVEHAESLEISLRLRKVSVGRVTSGTHSKERERVIEEYKNGDIRVMLNFGVLTTGFDAPNTDTVVIARPTTSKVLYAQMVGRGLRGVGMGGTEDCLVLDVADNFLEHIAINFNTFDQYWSAQGEQNDR